jgi:integrase
MTTASSLTVAELVSLYRRHCTAEGVHGEAAKASCDAAFGKFVSAHGHKPVAECKPYLLTDFIAANPRWSSSATRRKQAAIIRAAFQWAWKEERIARNPFSNVRYAEAKRRAEMPDDALKSLMALASKRFEGVLRFLRLTGCRSGELCAATWADVDLGRGVWTIPKHKTLKQTGKPKMVALVAEAVELLRSIASAPGAVTDGPIFLNSRGEPWTPNSLHVHLVRLKGKCRLETTASIHGIRHRFAGAAIANGAPLKLVAAQLGHSSVTTTEKYYVDLSGAIDSIRDAAQLSMSRPAARPIPA